VAGNRFHKALVGLRGLGGHRGLITATFPLVSNTMAATDARVGWPLCRIFAFMSWRVMRSSWRFPSRKQEPS
jgi:hypothetical protein